MQREENMAVAKQRNKKVKEITDRLEKGDNAMTWMMSRRKKAGRGKLLKQWIESCNNSFSSKKAP